MGEVTWYSNASGSGVRRQKRRAGDIQGVVPADSELGGVPGGGMPGKGTDPREIEVAFHIPTLEFEGGHHAGGSRTVTAA